MSTREDIAAALATVPGVTAPSPTPPPTPVAGAAWPVWTAYTWLNDCLRETTWYVYVVVPSGNLATRSQAADALAEPLGEALYDLGTLGPIEPVSLPPAEGTGQGMPALRATLTTTTEGGI